jgi:hypothetical protein
MSDTPIPPVPDSQGEEPQNITPFPAAADLGPEHDAPPTQEVKPTETVTLDDRILRLGDSGRALYDLIDGVLQSLESIPAPAPVLAASFGAVFQAEGGSFGCVASEFGNDIILKGLSGTMTEQRALSNQRRDRARSMPNLAEMLGALRAQGLKGPVEFTTGGTCGDPACPDCSAAASGPATPLPGE